MESAFGGSLNPFFDSIDQKANIVAY